MPKNSLSPALSLVHDRTALPRLSSSSQFLSKTDYAEMIASLQTCLLILEKGGQPSMTDLKMKAMIANLILDLRLRSDVLEATGER